MSYLVGISKNSRLLKEVDVPAMLVRKAHWELGEKVSATYRFQYQARTWKYPRWVVARLEMPILTKTNSLTWYDDWLQPESSGAPGPI